MKKRLYLFTAMLSVVLIGLLLAAPSTANADPLLEPDGAAASFDISDGESQERVITTSDGQTATIGIEKVGGPDATEIVPAWDSYYPNAVGQWRIYYNNPLIYREYYIYINSSHSITRAWGATYQTLLCVVTGEKLTRSTKSASYRLNWQAMADAASGVALLNATIEGTTLHTYAN